MFNSVAKYLWGGVENETDYSDRPEKDPQVEEISNPEDIDWVLVDAVDKENCCQAAHPHHHNNHLHHHCLYHHHVRPHPPQVFHDPTGVYSQAAGDIELLDDAASLAGHIELECRSSDSRVPTPDCHFPVSEVDSGDSSDVDENGTGSGVRPSSPESVFSACSGRSHATYRPKGQGSEAWVVAPPPCFTGSQIDDTEPLASSPLENLLIEHPSMSVYYSVPSSTLPSSHPLFSLPAVTDLSPEAGQAVEEGSAVVEQDTAGDASRLNDAAVAVAAESRDSPASVQLRRPRPHQAVLHSVHLCPEKLIEKSHIAQRHQVSQKQKDSSHQTCRRWNLVQAFSSSSKRNNHRHKLMRPSGCKASRNCQRSQRVH